MRSPSYDPFGAELRRFAETLDRRNFRAVSTGFGFGEIANLRATPTVQRGPTAASEHNPWHKAQTAYSQPSTAPFTPLSYKQAPSVPAAVVRRAEVPPAPPKPQTFASPPPPSARPEPRTPTPFFAKATEVQRPVQTPPPLPPLPATPKRAEETPSISDTFSQRQMAKLVEDTLKPLQLRPSFPTETLRALTRHSVAHVIDLVAVLMSLTAALFIAGAVLNRQPGVATTTVEAALTWAPVQMLMQMGLLYFGVLVYALFGAYWLFLKFSVGTTLGHTLAGFAIGREMRKS